MPYKSEIIPDTEESGYVASYPELPGCITCGETIANAVANAEDAKKAWLTAAIEDGIEIAEPETVYSYSGQFKLRLPKTFTTPAFSPIFMMPSQRASTPVSPREISKAFLEESKVESTIFWKIVVSPIANPMSAKMNAITKNAIQM